MNLSLQKRFKSRQKLFSLSGMLARSGSHSHCPNYKDICPDLPTSPMQLAAALATHPVPDVYFPKTVHDAEGLQSYPVPDTKGILMHLILPHSLRCPADAYFTQVVSHYPHLHRESDTGELRYGHFEDPLPSLSSLRLPVDMQGQTHHISGYRLLHWSPVITQNAHIDRTSLDTVLTVAGVLSFFTARSIRLNDENSKLLLLAPHNDTVGGLGSEGDKTVLLGHKNWNPISSSKCTVLARHG